MSHSRDSETSDTRGTIHDSHQWPECVPLQDDSAGAAPVLVGPEAAAAEAPVEADVAEVGAPVEPEAPGGASVEEDAAEAGAPVDPEAPEVGAPGGQCR